MVTKPKSIGGLTEDQYQYLLKHFTNYKDAPHGDKTPRDNMAGKLNENKCLIVDHGSTEYIVQDICILDDYTKVVKETRVVIPNVDSISVVAKGNCLLIMGLNIKDVLYIPYFNCDNLLSISHLANDLQFCVFFLPNFCFMQDLRTRNLIGLGECVNDFIE